MIAIVILNWNGWKDTLLCLESVFQLTIETPYSVIVCDNQSADGSLEKIEDWAQGRLPLEDAVIGSSPLPLAITEKPIVCQRLNRDEAESGESSFTPLTLIETGGNLGFAGGNNIGIRYALRNPAVSHIWLLNNDTVVHPAALLALLERQTADDSPGIVGSTQLYFTKPEVIQAQGGAHWDTRNFIAAHLGVNLRLEAALDSQFIESQTDYVVGASMLVSRDFLQQIGLMDERYFLYFEELDWALRAKGQFKLGYSAESYVFHKVGATINKSRLGNESPLSFYYLNRNRLWVVQRFWADRNWQLRARMLKELIIFAKERQFYKVRLLAYILLGRKPAEF